MEHQISNRYIRLAVSSTGAEMQSIIKDGREYLWNGDARFWSERAPILFPYVGRFTDGKYRLNNKTYEMGIHGFARKLPYHVTEREDQRITLELTDTEDTRKIYPYAFRLQVTYALRERTIEITYLVENRSNERMYFGIGGHPGFRLPFEEGSSFSDYYLEFEHACDPDRVIFTEACFLSGDNRPFPLEEGKRLRLSHSLFDEDAIVLQNMSDTVTLKTAKGTRQVTVSYPDCRYLGFWHAPKTEAPYLCIEPWASLPSRQDVIEDLRCKSDLIRLAPRGIYTNFWSITVN